MDRWKTLATAIKGWKMKENIEAKSRADFD
jgi:hypothetical protein